MYNIIDDVCVIQFDDIHEKVIQGVCVFVYMCVCARVCGTACMCVRNIIIIFIIHKNKICKYIKTRNHDKKDWTF